MSNDDDKSQLQLQNISDAFVNQTMLTCIGNKRKLVKYIKDIVGTICDKEHKYKLNIVDGFGGSNVVSRALCSDANNLYTNDLELYSYLMAKCYLETPSNTDQCKIRMYIDTMNTLAEKGPYINTGFIAKLYAPQDTSDIKEGERCFYTRENALIIDTLRKYIEDHVPEGFQPYCLVPLLNKASINTNTGGVFKGFYKDNNLGKFGGKKETNLSRIMKPIRLDMPIWSNDPFHVECHNRDVNEFIKVLPNNIDLIYLDPPYNQHPYGSNYFMLNVIAENKEPVDVSRVSGIPKNWNRSDYNYYESAVKSMRDLLAHSTEKSKYVLLSYNNEGIIEDKDWEKLFQDYHIQKHEIKYNAYRASRNLGNRSDKVMERMYLITKK